MSEQVKITNEMKAKCIGEFEFAITAECGECIDVGADEDCEVCQGGIAYERKITVPWDTCKEIYKRMAKYAPEQAARAQGGEAVAYMFSDEYGRTKIVLGKETAEHWCPPDETIEPLYTHPAPQTTPCDWCGYEYPDDMLQNETGAGDAICDECATNPPKKDDSKPFACVTDLGLGNGDRVVQWYVDPMPDGSLLYASPAPQITPAMIEAGAKRLVRWGENSTWPDSWSAMDVAAARQDAERVIRSALSVMGGGDEH